MIYSIPNAQESFHRICILHFVIKIFNHSRDTNPLNGYVILGNHLQNV